MSDAPERIWIEDEFGDGDDDQWTYGTWDVRNYAGYNVEYVRADLALPAVQPKVKPLVWEESLKDRWIGTPDSKLGDLAFWIFRHHDGTLKRATKEGWQFYPTLDAAQAAAQQDYAARILAALKGETP